MWKTILRRLQRNNFLSENEKLLRINMTKTDNRFVISLDFGYVLQHCNIKGSLFASPY